MPRLYAGASGCSRSFFEIHAMVIVAPEHSLLEDHSVLFRHTDRISVFRPDHSDDSLCVKFTECIVDQSARGLCCITLAPQIPPDVVADLDLPPSFNLLNDQATTATHLTR